MSNIFYKEKGNANRGFTLIETLVAITILMIAIVGPLTIAHRGLIAAVEAKDQMIASYLAQDAMEYIKNVRDNNTKDGDVGNGNWLGGMNNCIVVNNDNKKCSVDTVLGDPAGSNPESGFDSCDSDTCTLYLTDGGYGHNSTSGAIPTIFRRWAQIGVDNNGNDPSASVTVTVEWESTTGINSTVLKNQIFEIIR